MASIFVIGVIMNLTKGSRMEGIFPPGTEALRDSYSREGL